MARNVVEEFEECEGFKQQDERAENEDEIVGEAAEHVDIDDGGKVGRGNGVGVVRAPAVFPARGLARLAAGAALADQATPAAKRAITERGEASAAQ